METPAGQGVSYGFVRCEGPWNVLLCQLCGRDLRVGTCRQSPLAAEFLPVLQPYADALPHLILIKAPKGTSYYPTRRAYGHKLRLTQQVSVPSQTEVLICFFLWRRERPAQGVLKSLPALQFYLSLHVVVDITVFFPFVLLASLH